MSLATAQWGIDFVLANAVSIGADSIGLYFHGGGEPTLNWEVLTGALDYARAQAAARGVTVSAAMATNGVLRADQVSWIVRNLESASVSFDGRAELHGVELYYSAARPGLLTNHFCGITQAYSKILDENQGGRRHEHVIAYRTNQVAAVGRIAHRRCTAGLGRLCRWTF